MGLGSYLAKWIGKIKIGSEQTVVIEYNGREFGRIIEEVTT